MRKFALICSVVLFAVSVAIAAQDPPKQDAPKKEAPKQEAPKQDPSAQSSSKVLTGAVVSIDATKNEIVIKDAAGTDIVLMVSTNTKITREGKGIALADIKAGDAISADCEDSGGGCKAKAVRVTGPKSE